MDKKPGVFQSWREAMIALVALAAFLLLAIGCVAVIWLALEFAYDLVA